MAWANHEGVPDAAGVGVAGAEKADWHAKHTSNEHTEQCNTVLAECGILVRHTSQFQPR